MSPEEKRRLMVYWLCSTRPIAPAKVKKIVEAGSDLEEMFETGAHFEKYRIAERGREPLRNRASLELMEQEVDLLGRQRIKILTILDEEYPAQLRQIAVPPVMLYYKGRLDILGGRDFAIVGARRCTRRGAENTFRIAAELAENQVNIISGLARGIDTAAHRGALCRDGKTTAVLGCGIDRIYPPENKDLYHQIEDYGLLLSEYPLGSEPYAGNFPQRNRIISGLAQGVMLAEGKLKSGGSISVSLALEQNKEVFAMPGDISSPESELPNTLIDEGANVVLNARSILEPMGWAAHLTEEPGKADLNELDFFERELYNSLLKGEHTVDELIAATGQTPAQVTTALTTLEMRGHIRRLPGNAVDIKND